MTKATLYKLSELDGPEKQKQQIFKDLGNLKDFELLDEDILVATYARSDVIAEVMGPDGKAVKLYGTDNRKQEDRWQGKAALVVAMGPTAFRYHPNGQPYEGKSVKIGDWVVIHPSDGREIFLKDPKATGNDFVACRRVHWASILMRVDDPRRVY
ncbi:MAG: hypothetical protein E6R03_06065 [Hyphomicrobiaceae bacterium]|nr:MAG: hypothetical protein E6R03_06065 [Hyphomicrobiaceae bacterium]